MRSFANTASLLSLTLPVHNQALAGDSLTAIQFNHEWRRIVASALQFYWRHGDSTLALDNEDLLDDLLIDLYTSETIGSAMKTTVYNVILAANRSTALTTFQAVTDTLVNHTFDHANAIIHYKNVVLYGSNASFFNEAKPRVNAADGSQIGLLRQAGNYGHVGVASAIFSGLSTGVSLPIQLYFRSTNGVNTAFVSNVMNLVLEVVEYS